MENTFLLYLNLPLFYKLNGYRKLSLSSYKDFLRLIKDFSAENLTG